MKWSTLSSSGSSNLTLIPCSELPLALKLCGASGARARLAADDAITCAMLAAYVGVMNWTRSLGECWCVVMNEVSLQKAGVCAGGGQGSGPPQLLSTGDGEHSNLSIMRTAGMPLLMNDT